MSFIVLCNTGADSLSKIDLDTFEVKKYYLSILKDQLVLTE